MTQSIGFNAVPKELTETWEKGPDGNAVPVATVTFELRDTTPDELEWLGAHSDEPLQVTIAFP